MPAVPETARDEQPLDRDRPLRSMALFPTCCGIVLTAASFWNTIDLNLGELSGDEQVGLDVQVAIKLVIAALAAAIGFWGLIHSPRVRAALSGIPGFVLVLLAAVFLVTSIFALPQVAIVCRAAALIFVGYLLFIPTALVTLGLRGVIIASLIGLTANALLNWGVYLLYPSYGVYEEALTGNVFIHRMGGLGHPNAIGRTGVLAGLLSLTLLRRHPAIPPLRLGTQAILSSIIVLGIATIAATLSRASLLAGTGAVVMTMWDRFFTRRGIVILVAGISVTVFGLFAVELISGGKVFGDFLLSTGTKTGEIEELTTITGRTEIWAETLRLIGEKPITGWGLNSAPIVLNDFSQHPHNLLLHATLSGGIFAGLLVASLLLWNVVFGLTSAEPVIRAVSMYVLISGVFEDTCLDTFASPSTLLWLVVMLYPALSAGFPPHQLKIENDPTSSYNEDLSTA